MIPSIWEKDHRGIKLMICSSHGRYFNYWAILVCNQIDWYNPTKHLNHRLVTKCLKKDKSWCSKHLNFKEIKTDCRMVLLGKFFCWVFLVVFNIQPHVFIKLFIKSIFLEMKNRKKNSFQYVLKLLYLFQVYIIYPGWYVLVYNLTSSSHGNAYFVENIYTTYHNQYPCIYPWSGYRYTRFHSL